MKLQNIIRNFFTQWGIHLLLSIIIVELCFLILKKQTELTSYYGITKYEMEDVIKHNQIDVNLKSVAGEEFYIENRFEGSHFNVPTLGIKLNISNQTIAEPINWGTITPVSR
jgi:hypothetical protein